MVMSNGVCKRRQISLMGRIPDLEKMITTYPIYFHETTPKTFKCVDGCGGCCTTAFFFDDEYRKLPKSYHKGVTRGLLNEKQVISDKITGLCTFCKPKGCLIHAHRPMRCQVYPYFFVIDECKRCIYVMSQSFCIWPEIMTERVPGTCGTLCPGHVSDVSVEKSILSMVRPFLLNTLREKPYSLFLHFFKDTDILIDEQAILLYQLNVSAFGKIPYPTKSGTWVE